MKPYASKSVFWVARASRALVLASRQNNLFFDVEPEEKSAMAKRHRQHARRVRYPIGRAHA
jgi:hypothetical protein